MHNMGTSGGMDGGSDGGKLTSVGGGGSFGIFSVMLVVLVYQSFDMTRQFGGDKPMNLWTFIDFQLARFYCPSVDNLQPLTISVFMYCIKFVIRYVLERNFNDNPPSTILLSRTAAIMYLLTS